MTAEAANAEGAVNERFAVLHCDSLGWANIFAHFTTDAKAFFDLGARAQKLACNRAKEAFYAFFVFGSLEFKACVSVYVFVI